MVIHSKSESKLQSKSFKKQNTHNLEGQVAYQRVLGEFMNKMAMGLNYSDVLKEAIKNQDGLRQLILFENKQLLLDYFDEVKMLSSGMNVIEEDEEKNEGERENNILSKQDQEDILENQSIEYPASKLSANDMIEEEAEESGKQMEQTITSPASYSHF